MRWKEMLKDKKGVSPVIGVILMVAITVILAAVIASFVFGMGSKVKAAPNAQLVLSDTEDKIDESNGQDNILYITHYGGDILKCDELRVIVIDKTNGKSWVLTWNQTANAFDSNSNDAPYLIVNSSVTDGVNYHIATSGVLQVGDTALLTENGTYVNNITHDYWNSNNVPATIEIKIIHIPTNTIIYDGEQLVQ